VTQARRTAGGAAPFSKFAFDGGLNPTFKEECFEMDIVGVFTY